MSDKEKDGLGLPPVSSVVILLVVIGAVFFNIQNLKSSRPTVNSTSEYMRHTEDVRARLWQDPFGAVGKHKGEESLHDGIHSHFTLADEIAGKGRGVHIIGVMVEGGHYFENVEQKRRRRYAVVSALNVSSYKPQNAQNIGYFLTSDHKFKDKKEIGLPERIPYELFQYKQDGKPSTDKPLIVLLWLDEEIFGNNFFSKISALTEVLHLHLHLHLDESESSTHEREDKLKFTILGPASSTTVKSMAEELGRTPAIATNGTSDWDNLKKIDFKILSPIATAANDVLVRNLRSPKKDIGQLFVNNFPKGRFYRTIKSNLELGECIYDELYLRGVKPGKDYIVLVSEWDTDYGRELPFSLGKSFRKRHNNPTKGEEFKNYDYDEKTIIKYSYIRGLDGKVSDESLIDPSSQLQNISDIQQKEGEDNAPMGYANPSVGNRQFDYLRRMGVMIKDKNSELKRNGKGQIKAIGVLGSDEYDKLLVLQALRKKFPGVMFFTTDLDARFSDSDEIEWTRNIIVASNFGLSLHTGLQNDIPPFRDSYQTSVYFSTILALETDNKFCTYSVMKPDVFGARFDSIYSFEQKKFLYYFYTLGIHLDLNLNYQDPIYSLIRPRIFEVGRHNPCELRPEQEQTISSGGHANPILYQLKESLDSFAKSGSYSIYPNLPKYIPDEKQVYFLLYIFIFGAILLVAMVFKKKNKILPWILIIGYALIIFLSNYSTTKYFDNAYWCEPFSLFEGISIWPAEVLRVISIICSCLCLYYGYKKLKKNIEYLGEKYFSQVIPEEGTSSITEKLKGYTNVLTEHLMSKLKATNQLNKINNERTSFPIIIKVILIVETFILFCILFLRNPDGTWNLGSNYNLMWIVALIGYLIWCILVPRLKAIDQEKKARTSVLPNIIVFILVIISIGLMLSWDIIEKRFEVHLVYFYLIWIIPIGLLCWLIVRYVDNTAISRKWSCYREDINKYKMHDVWDFYVTHGKPINRCLRSAMIGSTFLLFSVFIMKLFGELYVPFRGDRSKFADKIIAYVSFLLFVFLLFYVVDAVRHCVRFVESLMEKGVTCPEKTRRKFGIYKNNEGIATDCWLKIKLIADRTEAVNNLINYPIYVILFLSVSYSTYFDSWFVPLSLYLLFGISLSIPILCSFLLRNEAMKAKDVALESLNKKLIDKTGKLCPGYNISVSLQQDIDQINLIIDEVKVIRKGAFVPFFQQPFVQSTIYLLGIIGAVLSQYFANRY